MKKNRSYRQKDAFRGGQGGSLRGRHQLVLVFRSESNRTGPGGADLPRSDVQY